MRRSQTRADDGRGTFEVAEYTDEIARARDNHQIGTDLWFENERIRVFELKLAPGDRAPFHVHDRTYFWSCVDAGRGLQRFEDGSFAVHEYELGETKYLVHTPDDPLIHDLENVGDSDLRFVTVEFKS